MAGTCFFLSAQTNEPRAPASRHCSIREPAALAFDDIAVFFHHQQLRVDRVDKAFAKLRYLL
jgi:hypothetical protein